MKKIALCIYTDDISYKPENDPQLKELSFKYELFHEYDSNLFKALRNISIKKRIFEMKEEDEFEICIAYDPYRAYLRDLPIRSVSDNTIYYAYGSYNCGTYVVGANPSLFYSRTIEFNRACEFLVNFENIRDYRAQTINEKFLFHLRSLYMESECINYEDSSMFVRTAQVY